MTRMYPRQLFNRVAGVLSLVFVVAFGNAQAAWMWQNPLPQGNQLNDCAYIDGATGYAVGAMGIVLRTSNRGVSWTTISSGVTSNLNRIVFVTRDSAWIFGDNGVVLWSINGGLTWRAQTSGTTKALYDAAFIDHFSGFAVGANGTILRTNNAGVNWTTLISGVTTDLHGVSFGDLNHGWVVGFAGTVLNTIDNGASWTSHTIPLAVNLYAVWAKNTTPGFPAVVNTSTAWIAGDNGNIWHTRTTGATWLNDKGKTPERINRFVDFNGKFKIAACNNDNITYCAEDDSVWLATRSMLGSVDLSSISKNLVADTGATPWTFHFACPKGGILKLRFRDSVISQVLVRDIPTWSMEAPGTRTDLYGIAFTGFTGGYAVGDSGLMLSTYDGLHWTSRIVFPGGLFRAIAFNPAKQAEGVIVGIGGLVMWTKNAGQTWTRDNNAKVTNRDWFSVSFSENGKCYITGATGMVARHDTLGHLDTIYVNNIMVGTVWRIDTTWINLPAPTNKNLYGIYMSDNLYGYVVGGGGVLYKTINAGVNWVAQGSGTTQDLYAVQIFHGNTTWNGTDSVEASNGFVLGNTGTVRRTTNGGVSWKAVNMGQASGGAFRAVRFLNQLAGVIVGPGGAIYASTDGGETWMNQPAPTTNNLMAVWAVSNSTAWTVGVNGPLLYNNDLALPVELSSFYGWADAATARLTWTTASELNSARYEIERRTMNGSWMLAGSVASHGTSSDLHAYGFSDNNLEPNTYVYRLKQIDNDGSYSYSATEVEVTIGTPTTIALYQNYPNPFNPSTRISYDLATPSNVTLDVYSSVGQRVATLARGSQEAGHYTVDFNASTLPSGMYEYILNVNGNVLSHHMTLLK